MNEHITRKTMDKAIIAKFPTIRPKTEQAKARLYALKAYLEFKSLKEVCAHGVSRCEVIRMYNRAHELHPDGRFWGFRICELNVYVFERTKKDGNGTFGRFQAWLNCPDKRLGKLREAIDRAPARWPGACTRQSRQTVWLPAPVPAFDRRRAWAGGEALAATRVAMTGRDSPEP